MAEATQTTEKKATATRSRSRSATKPAEAATAAPTAPANRVVVTLEPAGVTKSYSKWQAPEGSGCAGNFYAPLGVTEVKVAYTK